jgi:spore coat polysaccharide biosynthesis protein SpsF
MSSRLQAGCVAQRLSSFDPIVRVVAIIQARMGSTRLPGKVMMEILGKPMIGHVVDRALRISGVDQVVVATTDDDRDQPLVRYLSETTGVHVFRGPDADVLARYAAAAKEAEADIVVRLTADCPLLCPAVSSRVVAAILEEPARYDYVSNTLKRTYPRGLDTEAMSARSLELASREAVAAADREHVTSFLWRQPDRFRLGVVEDDTDRSHWRVTVDTREDLELVSRVYSDLLPGSPAFDYPELEACLRQHPEWIEINRHVAQKRVLEK